MHKYIKIFSILVISVLITGLRAKAQQQPFPREYSIIADLTEAYQVYDQRYESYVPYIKSVYQETQSVSVWLPLQKYKPYSLLLYAYPQTYLFIDKKLAYKFSKENWYTFSLDSLATRTTQSHVFLTFYNESYRLPLPTLCVVSKQKLGNKTELKPGEQPSLQILLRQKQVLKDLLTSLFLLLLVLFTLIWIYYRKDFLRYYSLRSSQSVFMRDDLILLSKPFSLAKLILLLFLSLTVSFVYVLIKQESAWVMLQIGFGIYKTDSLGYGWLNYLTLAMTIFAFLILKYIFNWVFANLLGLERIVNIHYFEYIRLSYLFYPNFAFLLTLLYMASPNWIAQITPYLPTIFILFYILQIIFLLFYTYYANNSKKLYIFYYLCITELTPFLISIKLLM